MITDQKQTTVPSKARVQLTKPVQTMNSGKTVPTTPKQVVNNTLNTVTTPKVEDKYNPFIPKMQSGNPLNAPYNDSYVANRTIPTNVQTDETGYNSKYGYDSGIVDKTTGENLFTNMDRFGQPVQATPSMQDKVEELGKLFSGATEEEQYNFLKRVADGIYKANGMQTGATMTGDQYIANSKQDQYK